MATLRGGFRGRPPPADSSVARAGAVLDAFVAATMDAIDRVALERDVRRQKKALAFHFGAIDRLAREFELDGTETLAVAVRLVDRWFGASAAEIGSVTDLKAEFDAQAEGRALQIEGGEMFQRWRRGGDPGAAQRLHELLSFD